MRRTVTRGKDCKGRGGDDQITQRMNGFTLSGWENFYVASAGASAAIAGLLFVALSINLGKILEIPGLAARAGETFIPLGVTLILSLLALVPGQSARVFAGELVVLGAVAWLTTTRIEIGAYRAHHYMKPSHMVLRVVIHQPATLAFVAAGVAAIFALPGGFYWVVPAVSLSFVGALINAWVLLVEILR